MMTLACSSFRHTKRGQMGGVAGVFVYLIFSIISLDILPLMFVFTYIGGCQN